MEVGELIAVGGLAEELKVECPFSDETLGVSEVDPENIAKDDLEAAETEQDSSGGTLGRNLVSGSNGAANTVGGPCPPPPAPETPRRDTRRAGIRVKVAATKDISEDIYGFTLAAHHLIPGDASLEPSPLKPFMTQDGSVEVRTKEGTKTKKVRKHIGYNVNGAHNGVWLPGNYFIRASTSPIKDKSWSELGEDPWCLNYVAAVTKAAGGQFHDAHTQYSAAVEELLTRIAKILSQHECDKCKLPDINPPFRIKTRLYSLSEYFKGQVTSGPSAWKRPWFTSDRWREKAFDGGTPSPEFEAAYDKAEVIEPALVSGIGG